jgi:hypothetical protein
MEAPACEGLGRPGEDDWKLYGYDEFIQRIGAVVTDSTTYNQSLEYCDYSV